MEPAAHSFTNSLYMIYVGEAHFSRSPYLVARLWIIAIIIIILCADILHATLLSPLGVSISPINISEFKIHMN